MRNKLPHPLTIQTVSVYNQPMENLITVKAMEIKVGDVVKDFHFAGFSEITNRYVNVDGSLQFTDSKEQTLYRIKAGAVMVVMHPVSADSWKQSQGA